MKIRRLTSLIALAGFLCACFCWFDTCSPAAVFRGEKVEREAARKYREKKKEADALRAMTPEQRAAAAAAEAARAAGLSPEPVVRRGAGGSPLLVSPAGAGDVVPLLPPGAPAVILSSARLNEINVLVKNVVIGPSVVATVRAQCAAPGEQAYFDQALLVAQDFATKVREAAQTAKEAVEKAAQAAEAARVAAAAAQRKEKEEQQKQEEKKREEQERQKKEAEAAEPTEQDLEEFGQAAAEDKPAIVVGGEGAGESPEVRDAAALSKEAIAQFKATVQKDLKDYDKAVTQLECDMGMQQKPRWGKIFGSKSLYYKDTITKLPKTILEAQHLATTAVAVLESPGTLQTDLTSINTRLATATTTMENNAAAWTLITELKSKITAFIAATKNVLTSKTNYISADKNFTDNIGEATTEGTLAYRTQQAVNKASAPVKKKFAEEYTNNDAFRAAKKKLDEAKVKFSPEEDKKEKERAAAAKKDVEEKEKQRVITKNLKTATNKLRELSELIVNFQKKITGETGSMYDTKQDLSTAQKIFDKIVAPNYPLAQTQIAVADANDIEQKKMLARYMLDLLSYQIHVADIWTKGQEATERTAKQVALPQVDPDFGKARQILNALKAPGGLLELTGAAVTAAGDAEQTTKLNTLKTNMATLETKLAEKEAAAAAMSEGTAEAGKAFAIAKVVPPAAPPEVIVLPPAVVPVGITEEAKAAALKKQQEDVAEEAKGLAAVEEKRQKEEADKAAFEQKITPEINKLVVLVSEIQATATQPKTLAALATTKQTFDAAVAAAKRAGVPDQYERLQLQIANFNKNYTKLKQKLEQEAAITADIGKLGANPTPEAIAPIIAQIIMLDKDRQDPLVVVLKAKAKELTLFIDEARILARRFDTDVREAVAKKVAKK
jgi:hypothetical protein